MSHYTEGRRYSHIHKAWILESGWNDSEEIAALRAQLAARDAEVGRLREALEAVDAWDINWADGLNENVERIKDMVRAALKGEDAT